MVDRGEERGYDQPTAAMQRTHWTDIVDEGSGEEDENSTGTKYRHCFGSDLDGWGSRTGRPTRPGGGYVRHTSSKSKPWGVCIVRCVQKTLTLSLHRLSLELFCVHLRQHLPQTVPQQVLS